MGKGIKIAVVGLGNVGFSVAQRIASESFPEKIYHINELVLCSTNPQRTATDTKTVSQIRKSMQMAVSYCPLERLETELPDIVINCASVPEAKKTTDRFEMGLLNMELNRKVCDYTPENALLMIVTNQVLDLQQDAINRGRLPQKTIGCTLVDTIRAISEIEKLARANHVDILDLSRIYVIGDHEDGSMILSPTSMLNGSPLEKYIFLEGKLPEIEKAIAQLAQEQVKARGNTNAPTAQAVVATLEAILTNGTVICGVECDFKHNFFGEAGKIKKPEGKITMSLPGSVIDLKVSLPGEGNLYEHWFEELPIETKQRVYQIAFGRQDRIRNLIAQGKVSAPETKIEISPLIKAAESQDKVYKILLAINKGGQGFVCEADSSGRINELQRRPKELRRVGIVEDKIFATTRDSVYFDGKEIKIPGNYQGNNGVNSFVKLGSRFFAAHSDLGLLCSDDGIKFAVIHGPPAREAVIFDGNVYFASEGLMLMAGNEGFEPGIHSEKEILSLIPGGHLLYAASQNGLYALYKNENIRRIIPRNNDLIAASKMGQNVLLLTQKGVIVYDPQLEVMPFYEMPGFQGITSNDKQAFVYNEFKIRAVFGEGCLTIPENEAVIISACAHSQPF